MTAPTPPCPYCGGALVESAGRLQCVKFDIDNFPLPVEDAA